MARKEHTATLDKLIERTKDSARGFQSAQSDVTDHELSDEFESLTTRRVELVEELQRATRRLGSDADDASSPLEALERGWLSIKAAMTIEHDKTDAIVLANRAENEDELLEAYEEALEQSLPPEIQQLLQRQYKQVKETKERLLQLEEEVRSASDYEH